MLSLGSTSSSGPFEAKEWTQMLKLSAEFMNCITKRRPEKTGYMKISVVITRISQGYEGSGAQLSYQVANRLEK